MHCLSDMQIFFKLSLFFSIKKTYFYWHPVACRSLASWPGIEPVPPALDGRVLTTGPPVKSLTCKFSWAFSVLSGNPLYKPLSSKLHSIYLSPLSCVVITVTSLCPSGLSAPWGHTQIWFTFVSPEAPSGDTHPNTHAHTQSTGIHPMKQLVLMQQKALTGSQSKKKKSIVQGIRHVCTFLFSCFLPKVRKI